MTKSTNQIVREIKSHVAREEARFHSLTYEEQVHELAMKLKTSAKGHDAVMRRYEELHKVCLAFEAAAGFSASTLDKSHDSVTEKDTTASYLQHILSRVAAVAAHLTSIARLTVEGLMGGLQPIPVLGGSAEEGVAEKVHQAVEISGWQSEGNLLRITIVWNGDGPSTEEEPEIIVLNGTDVLTAGWTYFAQREDKIVGIAKIDWNGTAPYLKSISDVSGDILVIQWSATEQTLVLEFRL